MQHERQQVVLTSYSQPHVLQQRMKQEKITHGQTVKADLSPVRLESTNGKMVMYFCPMESVSVTKKILAGDGGPLPSEATLNGLTVPGDFRTGLYNLKNVTLHSNGTLQVLITEETVFQPVYGSQFAYGGMCHPGPAYFEARGELIELQSGQSVHPFPF